MTTRYDSTKHSPTDIDMTALKSYIVILNERGSLYPLLDYSLVPIGNRYPIKTFGSYERAVSFVAAEGHENYEVVTIKS